MRLRFYFEEITIDEIRISEDPFFGRITRDIRNRVWEERNIRGLPRSLRVAAPPPAVVASDYLRLSSKFDYFAHYYFLSTNHIANVFFFFGRAMQNHSFQIDVTRGTAETRPLARWYLVTFACFACDISLLSIGDGEVCFACDIPLLSIGDGEVCFACDISLLSIGDGEVCFACDISLLLIGDGEVCFACYIALRAIGAVKLI